MRDDIPAVYPQALTSSVHGTAGVCGVQWDGPHSHVYTRLSKNRIMLHADDIEKLVAWVRDRKNAANDWTAEPAIDPFAK